MAGNSTKNGLAHLANIAALQAQKPETKVVKLQAIFRTQKRINFLRRGLAQLVAEARDAGASWTEIGDALEVSRQGARQRFGASEDLASVGS